MGVALTWSKWCSYQPEDQGTDRQAAFGRHHREVMAAKLRRKGPEEQALRVLVLHFCLRCVGYKHLTQEASSQQGLKQIDPYVPQVWGEAV